MRTGTCLANWLQSRLHEGDIPRPRAVNLFPSTARSIEFNQTLRPTTLRIYFLFIHESHNPFAQLPPSRIISLSQVSSKSSRRTVVALLIGISWRDFFTTAHYHPHSSKQAKKSSSNPPVNHHQFVQYTDVLPEHTQTLNEQQKGVHVAGCCLIPSCNPSYLHHDPHNITARG